MESQDFNRQLEDTVEDISQMGAHLARLTRPETRFQEWLERITRSLRWSGKISQDLLTDFPRNMPKKTSHPGAYQDNPLDSLPETTSSPSGNDMFKLYLFDAQGRRIILPDMEKGMIVISERYFEMIRKEYKNPFFPFEKTEKRLAESFSGNAETVKILAEAPEKVHDLRGLGIQKYGGWFPFKFRNGSQGYLLAWINAKNVSYSQLAEKAVAKLYQRAGNSYHFVWLDITDPNSGGTEHNLKPSQSFWRTFAKDRLDGFFVIGKKVYCIANTSSEIRLIVYKNLPSSHSLYKTAHAVLLFLAMQVILFVFLRSLSGRGFSFSIRAQLTTIFGIAGLASFSALLGYSHIYSGAKQESLIRLNRQNSLKILEKVDSNFFPAFSYLPQKYRGMVKELERDFTAVKSILKPLEDDYRMNKIKAAILISDNGNSIFRIPENRPSDNLDTTAYKYDKLIANIGKQVLFKFNFNPGLATDSDSSLNGMFNVILDRPVDNLIRDRASLQNLNIGGQETTNFVDIIHDKKGNAAACLFILHNKEKLETEHIKNVGRVFQNGNHCRLLAISRGPQGRMRAFPNLSIAQEPDLAKLQELLSQTESVHHIKGKIKGREILITAIPGKNLSDYNLYLVTSFSSIARQARSISRSFALIAIITTLFVTLLGWLLAGSLLGPIQLLAKGINNLSGMRLDEQVVVNTGDELEFIGSGLNMIMTDLKEFALARTVQESLFPLVPLRLGGIHCQGWSRSASDIGGELFDFFELPNAKIAFLVADLSGHGVSSALIMAMSKMATRLFLELHFRSPAEVLKELDLHFRLNIKRLTQMSFFLGILDTQSSNIIYSGGGVCFPFLVRPDKKIDLLSISSQALGGRQNIPFQDKTIDFGARNRLVICTDGIINAKSPTGKILSTEGILEMLAEMQDAAGEHFGTALFKAIDQFSRDRRIEEDQTVLVLENSAKEFGNSSNMEGTKES